MKIFKFIMGLILLLLPFIILAYNFYLTPRMLVPISGPKPSDILVYEMVIAGAWIIAQIILSVNRNSSVFSLISDSLLGIVSFGIMTTLTGWMYGMGAIPWAIVVPWVISFLDAILSAAFAINNAAQKPLVGGAASV